MKFDLISKVRHGLQVMAFCLAISAVQYAFTPERPYGPLLIYSLAIGITTWAVIDFGRDVLSRHTDTGWPQGFTGILLVVGGIVGGYFMGNLIGDRLCQVFGPIFGWARPPGGNTGADLRSSILITALAGIAGSYYFYSANRSMYLERKMTEARGHATEARLKLLETQLEPHMLFNTLANLRVLIATDAAAAQDMLDRMIAYLRATLDASRATTHSLEAEFDRLRDYLELMKVRMGTRLTYTLELPAGLAAHAVPTLLLQPLVENAIQHGLEPKVGGGEITVRARREGGDLVLEVADTGVGSALAPSGGKGFGLTQVRERLATLYETGATLDFSAVPGEGARVTARFPCAG